MHTDKNEEKNSLLTLSEIDTSSVAAFILQINERPSTSSYPLEQEHNIFMQ